MHHLGRREAISAGVIFIAAKIFLAFPRTMAELGGPAGWMIVLIGSVFSCLSLVAILGLLALHPGKSLQEATEATLGPVLGSLVNLGYFAFFYFTTFVVLRQFGENLVAAILPRTPLNVVLLLFLAVIVYGTLLGIEAITRVSWLCAPFMVIGTLSLLAGGLYSYRGLNPFSPVWGPGALAVIGWGLMKASLLGEILLIGIVGNQFRSWKDLVQVGWWTLAISAVFLLLTVGTHLTIFPHPSASRVSFPVLEISRLIVTGRWLQRVESIFLIIWVLAGALKLMAGLYGACRVLAQMMQLNSYRPLVTPLAVTVLSLALLPPNLPAAVDLDANLLRNYGWVISVVLPGLTWFVAALRKGGERTHAA